MKTFITTLILLVTLTIPICQSQVYYNASDDDEFQKSPCWEEIGYSPYWTKEQARNLYRLCEEEKRGKVIEKVIYWFSVIAGISIFILIVVYISNSNKRMWEAYRDKYDTEKDFKEIINKPLWNSKW